ncbi:MAG TPA: hypothetical protein VHB79_00865 [Polyangiaceae bacterium]|nr:hypothetical protein [Polyangiaceae bacterium]
MKRLICATIMTTWLLGSGAASAEPDEGAKLVARELMAKGRAQRDTGDLPGAIESFSKAHAIMHVPTTLLELARAQVDGGQWVETLELLRELSSMPPTDNEPAPFTRARSDALQLGQQLEPRVPNIRVDISGAPQGPAPLVTLDGAPRPDCVAGCYVNPGPHLVAARTARTVAEEQLRVAAGDRQTLELVFSPIGAPEPSTEAHRAEQPPPRPPAVARRVPLAAWIAGGVSLAGFAAGSVLGVNTISQRNELRDSCAPHCSSDDVNGVRREAVLANVSFGVGLSAAAVAVISYVMAPGPRPGAADARRLRVAAAPDSDGHGGQVTLGAQF